MEFKNRVLIIGYGAVCKCMLPILLRHVNIPLDKITIIDFKDKSADLKAWTAGGLRFVKKKITPKNLTEVLAEHLSPGGLLIDVAWNIDCCEVLQWCHDNNVLYVNTSVEAWDPDAGIATASPYEKTLYYRQMKLMELTKDWENATTCVVDHGANPGLISHFAKHGLVDIANRMIADKLTQDHEKIKKLIIDQNFAELAMETGVKVIHCSEHDTQISRSPKKVGEFVGTWCIEGLREEGVAPAEIGWGTHEKTLPPMAIVPPVGPKNGILIPKMGLNTWVRSWIPNQEIIGMVIRHGEAFGISSRWTVWKEGEAIYRPTVHYAYMPCDATIASIHELRARNYELQPKLRIMSDREIVSGADILGALLMGHPYKSWWTGSILPINEAKKLAPGQNATTIQVALGVVTAVMWMIDHPKEGFCLPDDLPHEYVLDIAKPYLGEFWSGPSDWTPLKNRTVFFKENPENNYDREDIWQFKNFLFVQ